MAVAVPIGALTSVSVLDAIAALAGDRGDGRTARRTLLGLGLLSALPAAAAGVADWSDTSDAERRVGAVHAASNAIALSLYAASWLARGRSGRGRLLAAAGLGAMALGGWLGGHLAYALGVGVDLTAFDGGPTEWTEVGSREDFPVGQPVAVEVGPVSILVLRQPDDRFVALANRCTHRGGPLADGKLEGGCITCPWHGSQFRLEDGEVQGGPATRPQPAYATRLRSGTVEIRRDEVRALRTNPV